MGNGKGRGLSVLAAEGLVTRYTYRCFLSISALSQDGNLRRMLTCLVYVAAVHANPKHHMPRCAQAYDPACH